MKTSLRSIVVLCYMGVFLVLALPYHLYLVMVGKKDEMRRFRKAAKTIRWAFGCELRNAGVKINVIGKENIPEDASLFVSNHRSYFDILVMQKTIPHPLGFIAKKEMESYPLLPFYMKDIGCLFLDRTNIKEGLKTILKGVNYLKQGLSLNICPEGTRNQSPNLLPFKDGSLKIAEKAKCPVVPVALIGTENLLENNPGFTIKKGIVTIAFGKPFYMSDLEGDAKKHPGAYVQSLVDSMRVKYADTIKSVM